jgi:hypothetical protein
MEPRWRSCSPCQTARRCHLAKVNADRPKAVEVSVPHELAEIEALSGLSMFRDGFYDCLDARANPLFELADVVICADGPVTSLAGLSLAPVFHREHGRFMTPRRWRGRSGTRPEMPGQRFGAAYGEACRDDGIAVGDTAALRAEPGSGRVVTPQVHVRGPECQVGCGRWPSETCAKLPLLHTSA